MESANKEVIRRIIYEVFNQIGVAAIKPPADDLVAADPERVE
jgi:hypothetical protein